METLFFRVAAASAAVSVVLLPLLLATRWRKRYAPHTRRAVWLVIAAVLLAAPLLPKSRAPVQITVPERAVTLPAAVPATPQSGTAPIQAAAPETVLPETPVQTAAAPALAETPAARTVEWGALLAALWLTGGAAVLLWQVTAYLLARRRVMRSAILCTDFEELAKELCPRRSVRFFRVDGFQTPMTLGVFRPAVLLPQGEVRQAAVRHELIHVRRRDVAWKALLLLACAVHWFNPLAWLLSRRADRDMEASCDAAVLAGGDAAERRAYGELLLETAAGRNIPLTTRFGGGKKLMKERLYDLFHPGKKSRVLVAAVLLLCLAAGSLVVCKGAENGSDGEADVPALDGRAAQEESVPGEGGHAIGYELHQVVLPSSEREKNVYNAEIFAIDPFAVNLYLPAGWTVREAAAMRQEGEETYPAVDGLFSVQCILNETGRPVGSLGYNLAPACEDGTDNPMALFAGITMAKYRFDVWETYDPVVEAGSLTVALTDVVQDYSHPEGIETTSNRGLLLRDENFGVYVAIELDSGVLTDEQILDIAGHLSLCPTLREEYDFDHDGEADPIELVPVCPAEENYVEWYELQVKDADGTILWTGEAHPQHVGWASYFVCTLNGEDYLLRYYPTMFQGLCTYTYQLFCLGPEGEEIVLRENSVSFDTNFGSPLFESFDATAIADFMDDVNGLLAHSKLLLSTDEELKGVDPESPQHMMTWLTRDNSHFGYTYDETRTMRENLLALELAAKDD